MRGTWLVANFLSKSQSATRATALLSIAQKQVRHSTDRSTRAPRRRRSPFVAMEIYYMYAKTRKEFGRHARFEDEPCEVRAPGSASPCRVFTPWFDSWLVY